MQYKNVVINVTQMLNIIIYTQNTDSFKQCIVLIANRGLSQSIQFNKFHQSHYVCMYVWCTCAKIEWEEKKKQLEWAGGRLWTHVSNICMSTKWQNVVIVNVVAVAVAHQKKRRSDFQSSLVFTTFFVVENVNSGFDHISSQFLSPLYYLHYVEIQLSLLKKLFQIEHSTTTTICIK